MTLAIRQMRWQIATAYILLILFTLGGLAAALYGVTRDAYLRTLEAGVAGQARLVATLAETVAGASPERQLDPFFDNLGRQLGIRITLIDVEGWILADSLLPPERYTNLRDRPEVQAALIDGRGEMARYSTATGDDRFYVAVPFRTREGRDGIARVGVPLATIASAQSEIALTVLVAALVAALLAIGVAILIARRTAQPLRELGEMARRLAAGDLDVRVPVPNDAEVAALAQSFNQMASRLRQQIDARAREGERLATILATMEDGILILDTANQVTLANRAASHALTLTLALPFELAHISFGPQLGEAARTLHERRDTPLITIEELIPPAGDRSMRAVLTRLGSQTPPQTLVVLQDLTELRRAERARRLLLANVTHDLRTPLASLQTLLDALDDGAIDEPDLARDFLRRMTTEVQGLSRLVDEFLELSRIELGQVTLSRSQANPHGLLTTAARRMEAQARQKRVQLMVQPAERLPLIHVDVNRMEQVLLNLLQNALTATPPGGQITLGAQAVDGEVILTVHDTGVGIAPADLPHIFERFYKADPARSGGGAGLGLAIVKHLVERHAGYVAAESVPGAGTTITVRLPADPPWPADVSIPVT